MKNSLLFLIFIVIGISCFAQDTYKIGETEYYYNEYYTTTGNPKVKRSEANKLKFLRSLGYERQPVGYEVDHIIPLSQGGTDSPENMQLITKQAHALKTARERAAKIETRPSPGYTTSNGFIPRGSPNSQTSTYYNNKVIYRGANGGEYYINKNGNKTYIETSRPKVSSQNDRMIYTGSRGGEYYINKNGNKTYIESSNEIKKRRVSQANQANWEYTNDGRKIYTGPRGGRYYINKNGNKTYIKK